tara:strand:+ start:273 stop:653 length:381 start_codon:yes stop_codon:yes gene_type:complete
MSQKHSNAYKTIGEVAKDLKLINPKTGKINTHTIRYWEKEFKQIKPKIFAGKRRYYDQKSIETLKKIRFLLKEKGFTINGVKKFLVNESSFNLDESFNRSINTPNKNLKSKLEKISNLLKELKKLG